VCVTPEIGVRKVDSRCRRDARDRESTVKNLTQEHTSPAAESEWSVSASVGTSTATPATGQEVAAPPPRAPVGTRKARHQPPSHPHLCGHSRCPDHLDSIHSWRMHQENQLERGQCCKRRKKYGSAHNQVGGPPPQNARSLARPCTDQSRPPAGIPRAALCTRTVRRRHPCSTPVQRGRQNGSLFEAAELLACCLVEGTVVVGSELLESGVRLHSLKNILAVLV